MQLKQRQERNQPVQIVMLFVRLQLMTFLSESHGISQNDIVLEFKAHKHSSCRKMLKCKQLHTREAARELADHCIFSHNIQDEK